MLCTLQHTLHKTLDESCSYRGGTTCVRFSQFLTQTSPITERLVRAPEKHSSVSNSTTTCCVTTTTQLHSTATVCKCFIHIRRQQFILCCRYTGPHMSHPSSLLIAIYCTSLPGNVNGFHVAPKAHGLP